MSRPNAKAATSPRTPSAPTTCKVSPGALFFQEGPPPQLRFGHIPGNALTVEGLQRKLGPLSLFWVRRDQIHCRKIMAITTDVASHDREMLNCGVSTNKEIG